MNNRRKAQLAVPPHKVARLFAGSGSVSVDVEAGVIRNAAVMTVGPAMGHGFFCDARTLSQVAEFINKDPGGVRVRLKHPGIDPVTGGPVDATATMVGRCRNARIVGNQVRGDIHLGAYAASLPGHGNARSYLLSLAGSDPKAIGLSAVIEYETESTAFGGTTVAAARIFAVEAVDFAEFPAANPNGLLSAKHGLGVSPGSSPLLGVPAMDPVLTLLQSLGLDPSITDAAGIAAFVATLTPEQQAEVTAAGYSADWAPMAEGSTEEEDKPAAAAAAAKPAAKPAPAKLAAKPSALAVAETQRATALRQLATAYRVGNEFAELHIGMGTSPEAFSTAARAELSAKYKPLGTGVASLSVGVDRNIASLVPAISDGIRLRAGLKVATPHERASEFRGRSLVGVCHAYLGAIGVDTKHMSDHEAARLVFNRGKLASLARAQLAHTTGDFSNILGDTIGKSLRQAYEETASTWEQWVRRGTATDFKQQTRVQLSAAPDLLLVKEAGEYKDGYFSDGKEVFTLAKYGRIVTVTSEMIINDDLDAFSRIPTAMGQAAKRKEDDVVYYTLLKNATMGDTGALFNATALTTAGGHANLSNASATPTIALLNTAVAAMAVQRAPAEPGASVGTGPVLNLQPEFLLAPPALAGTVWELLNSTSYAVANGNANIKSRFGPGGQVSLKPVIEPRLQSGVTLNGDTVTGSSAFWYLAAAMAQIDTMELAFLSSEPSPVTEEEEGFRVDGRSYKIRHTMQAKAIDYRGLYKYGT
jgi:hypothetical protein